MDTGTHSVETINCSDNNKNIEKTPAICTCVESNDYDNTNQNNNSLQNLELVSHESVELPWWFPRFCGKHVFYGNPEAFGWCLEATARYIAAISSAAFLATAWLNLAKEAAGCDLELEMESEDEIIPCNNTIYGMKPSSALSMYAVFVGVFSSIALPILGAFVDYTCHRRLMGRWCSFLLCIFLVPTIFISNQTWELVAACFIVIAVVSWGETAVSNAYLPELTTDEDRLNYFMMMFSIIPCVSIVVFLMGILGLAYVLGIEENDIAVARLAQAISFGVTVLLLALAWGPLLKRRPKMNHLSAGQSIWTEGFIQVYRTCRKIRRNYNALKWFYIAIMFGEAGSVGFLAIAVTYQIDTLMLSSTETGIALLVGIIGTVPGAYICTWVNKRFNPIQGSIGCMILLMAIIVLYIVILTGPGQQYETIGIAFLWGVGSGWKWTCDRLLASVIIPEGQDAELMGFYSCAEAILTWMPTVLFTILNELNVSQRIGTATAIFFFLVGTLSFMKMGGYRDALLVANRIVANDDALALAPTPSLQLSSSEQQAEEPT